MREVIMNVVAGDKHQKRSKQSFLAISRAEFHHDVIVKQTQVHARTETRAKRRVAS